MNTVIFYDGATLTSPDVALAFSNEWCTVTDTTGDVARVTISAAGVSETRDLYGGTARLSLLPFIRATQAQVGDQLFATSAASRLAHSLGVELTAYNAAGVMLGGTHYTQNVIFGAGDIYDLYIGERFITYNAAVTESAISLMLHDQQAVFNLYDREVTVYRRGILQNEALSRFILSTTPGVSVFSCATAGGLNGGESVTGALVVHVTKDTRTRNIVNLRWIDPAGGVNYRTFATGEAQLTTGATSAYERPTYGRSIAGGYDPGDNVWSRVNSEAVLYFGDNAIEAGQFPWLCSLLASSVVERQVPGGWQRVNISDAQISQDTRRHVFNFNAAITLPRVEGQQW